MSWPSQSRQARGYGAQWQKLRLVVLQRDYWLCQCPECFGGKKRVRPASEVDHIVPKAQGGTDALSNLRAVNPECHRALGLAQRGFAPKTAFDSRGNPRDPKHPWNCS